MSADDALIAVMQAAKVLGESDDGRWRGTASQSPGVGWLPDLPQPPSSAGGLGNPGMTYPVVGEGWADPAPQPRQVKSIGGELAQPAPGPSYAGPEVSGRHFSYGPQAPREVSDLGDGRIMVEQRSGDAGPVLISPAVARAPLWQRLAGRLRRK